MPQQRVLADGWGQQSSGSVFCADSSLRYIYESHGEHALPSQQSSYRTSIKASSPVVTKSHLSNDTTFVGKRLQDVRAEIPRGYGGVDLFEAGIARACTTIRKQAASLPPSYCECSVCLSTNAYAQLSSCGHTFHPNCFLRWFRMNRSCPLCRGAVDKVQLAPTLAVQDELAALMAEIDDEPFPLDSQLVPRLEAGFNEPVLSTSDQFMSFLEADFETDMDLVPLDELSSDGTTFGYTLAGKQEVDGDETMEMEFDDLADLEDKHELKSYTEQQFPPASTVPNYWNVLNQGITPPIMPPAPAVPPFVPNHQKMVHIAPKPENRTVHQHVRSTTDRTAGESCGPPVADTSQQTALFQHAIQTGPSHFRVVSCRCTGGCRNGRCACVKEGGMCGTSCRCTSCKNPFLMVKATGADIDVLFQDDCFMHNVSKTRDMGQRLQDTVTVPCCEATIQVVDCVHGFKCEPCTRDYEFSWCLSKLVDSERTPRNHCAICKRCCDHRDVHCKDCGRCYFAGVTASLPCPCKGASSHKKRREAAMKDRGKDAEEEAEGDCCIM